MLRRGDVAPETAERLAGVLHELRAWLGLDDWIAGLSDGGSVLVVVLVATAAGLSGSDVQLMTEQLRHGLVAKTPAATLEGEVEIDEVYVVAGHKGQPAAVATGGEQDGAAGGRERRAAAHWRRTSRRSSA